MVEFAESRSLRRGASNVPMIVLLAALVVAAFVVYRWMSASESGSDATGLTCQKCQYKFKLSQDAVQDLIEKHKVVESDPKLRGSAYKFKCPKCGAVEALEDDAAESP